MQTTILVGCRNFECNNNKSGQCLLARMTLQDDGTPNISKVVCIEAEYKPEVKDDNEEQTQTPNRQT